ncbi:OsmC family protein [bacterium]|nr:OsmC family protein [bacterium]
MKVLLRHSGQMAFLAKADSNHWLPLDTGPVSGGSNGATSPIELLVIAAAGCVSMDVIFILGKGRHEFSKFDLEVEAARAENHPRRLISLHFHAQVEGPALSSDAVSKALTLSLTKYCSVSLSLDRSITFKASCTVNGVPSEAWNIERNPDIYAQSGLQR